MLFEVNRSYKELIERINRKRFNYMKNLPWVEMIIAVVNNDYIDVDDDIHLPVGRISVLVTGLLQRLPLVALSVLLWATESNFKRLMLCVCGVRYVRIMRAI